MRCGAAIGLCMMLAMPPALAGRDPPQITWDWFRAAEAYRRYPNATRADLLIAARYHRRAAEQGNAASAYKLAEMYENGIGLAQDYGAALKWYRAAAESGDRHGQVRLGWFLQEGLGTPKDPGGAVSWFERAAAQDDPWAFHMLAIAHDEGKGVPKDPGRARAYFERSVPRTQDGWAKWRLGTLIADREPARARKLFREAAAAGIGEAAAHLRARGW
jgi:TPR repeat protein